MLQDFLLNSFDASVKMVSIDCIMYSVLNKNFVYTLLFCKPEFIHEVFNWY